MDRDLKEQLLDCLVFNSNSLARAISKLADGEFKRLGLSSSYAFLLLLVNGKPDISLLELAGKLHLSGSTVSRFSDSLARRGLVVKRNAGKIVLVDITAKGQEMIPKIRRSLSSFEEKYQSIIGKGFASKLSRDCNYAFQRLRTY